MTTHKITVQQLDEILPQTQCGLCDHDGCKPYAEAIVNDGEAINKCPPGGVRGLLKLAKLTDQDPAPYLKDMQEKEKPLMIARIREDECIGCVKCISACPVDAILGSSKHMHTVIESECTGCELCIEPCPVDCIDLINIGKLDDINEHEAHKKANHYRERFQMRKTRLQNGKDALARKHQQAKLAYKTASGKRETLDARKKAIAEAVQRMKNKA